MNRFFLGLLLVVACNGAGSARREDSMPRSTPPPSNPAPGDDPDVAMHLSFALTPHGNRPDLAQKEASIRWLLEHADRAYPIVLARAKATPNPALVHVLGRFGRAESTPLLTDVLTAGGAASGSAGVALGGATDSKARAVLVQSLGHANPRVVTAALDGLRVRGDRSVCADVLPLIRHADGEVRYVCVRTGAALGCLDAAALRALASSDADPEVRKLAADLSQGASP